MTDYQALVRTGEVVAKLLADDGLIPNNPRLPLLLYKQAIKLGVNDPAEVFETLFTANGWPAAWRNGIFPFHHYHSTAHEALGVYSGSATALIGGEQGIECIVEAGDVIIIPAGVGHKGLTASADLGIVGAYPTATGPDMCKGEAEQHAAHRAAIAEVQVPERDPLFGVHGPMHTHWPR